MSTCSKCGAELNSGAKFCTKCGTPVVDVVPVFHASGSGLEPVYATSNTANPTVSNTPNATESNTSDVSNSTVNDIPTANAAENATGNIAENTVATDIPTDNTAENEQVYNSSQQEAAPTDKMQNNYVANEQIPNEQVTNGYVPNEQIPNAQASDGQPQYGYTPNRQAPNGQPQYGYAPNGFNPQFQQTPPKKKSSGKIIVGVVCAIIAVLAIVLVLIFSGLFSSKAYEKPINNFEKAINKHDSELLLSTLPIGDATSGLLGLFGVDDYADSLMDSVMGSSDFDKIDIEVTGATRIDSDDLQSIADSSDFTYFLSSSFNLTDGYYVDCTVTCSDSYGDTESVNATFTVCKWNGDWYIFDFD